MCSFERIERMIVDARQPELAADLLKILLNKYRDAENPDRAIEFLKKILNYRPDDIHSRRELIKFYEIKYGSHSQFQQFMKLSRLNNFKAPVKFAIQDFEKNIVFDKGNYAYHNSWGLGRIEEIDSEGIIISFRDKESHAMSIKMALQSLTPVTKDHFYVMKYEDPQSIKELFENDFLEFFNLLVKSYGGEILVSIKVSLYLNLLKRRTGRNGGARRTQIKKDPLFRISNKEKNLVFIRGQARYIRGRSAEPVHCN